MKNKTFSVLFLLFTISNCGTAIANSWSSKITAFAKGALCGVTPWQGKQLMQHLSTKQDTKNRQLMLQGYTTAAGAQTALFGIISLAAGAVCVDKAYEGTLRPAIMALQGKNTFTIGSNIVKNSLGIIPFLAICPAFAYLATKKFHEHHDIINNGLTPDKEALGSPTQCPSDLAKNPTGKCATFLKKSWGLIKQHPKKSASLALAALYFSIDGLWNRFAIERNLINRATRQQNGTPHREYGRGLP
jgi:hypothetical protein